MALETIENIKSYKNSQKEVKTDSIRKLSDFYFQWTKTLYQNNLSISHSSNISFCEI